METSLQRDPVYQQLNDRLRGALGGEYQCGDKFLTEREISQQFEVSRATANKALASLVSEGLLEFRRGVGTFVRRDLINYDVRSLVSFTEKAKAAGRNCYLNDDQKIKLCEICTELNADWVKTSSGYGTGGATQEDLKLMRKHAGDHVQVKAAGGVRDLDTLLEVRALGVTRCGASRTAEMLGEARERLGMPAIEATASGASGY